ncbi:hypothetical protein P167DRAFT_99069 [Morchella conica CCBAS932]|uniref:Uncharacterized protein n=1 Tax=Morchella conica CCBAS932 TaxID=1392247 RepID=A0A3N4KX31_9PEZI|nr:hypothetical protein P167DRAFT_99069 [Morchella conica CCBAS932]
MTRLEFQPYESDNDDDNHDDNDKSWPRSSIMLSPFGPRLDSENHLSLKLYPQPRDRKYTIINISTSKMKQQKKIDKPDHALLLSSRANRPHLSYCDSRNPRHRHTFRLRNCNCTTGTATTSGRSRCFNSHRNSRWSDRNCSVSRYRGQARHRDWCRDDSLFTIN